MAIQPSSPGLLQRAGAFLRRRPAPRQTRLYCVGAPRTGTHSIAAIFDRTIRARHEPGLGAAMKAVLAHHAGTLPFDGLRRFVADRDRRLRLDVDSSHVNVFLIDALRAEFADARFVLTIRDCYTWLDSAMNHTRNSGKWSGTARRYLEFYFDAKRVEYSPHDAFLAQRGLLSVDCYLAAWRRHNERALASVPSERLLVVGTAALSQRLPQIAALAGIPAERIHTGFRREGAARTTHGILDQIDPGYLQDRVATHCAALMLRFFPDIRSRQDAPR